MKVLDFAFYYLVVNLKQYAVHIPHSVTIHASCKVLNLEMSGFLGIRIHKGKNGRGIFPQVEKLKGSFGVLSSSVSVNKDFCLIEPQLYDETGRIMFKKCKCIFRCECKRVSMHIIEYLNRDLS